jgi:hypothetical protein
MPVNSVEDMSKIIDAAMKLGRRSVLFQIQVPNGFRFIALPLKG